MITAATSASTEVAEELLGYFVDIGNKECFAAMLYACFDLLREDVVEELSWQHGLNDFYMPYKIQKKRSLIEKVAALEKQVQEQSRKDTQKEQQEADAPIINPGMIGSRLMITQGNGYVHSSHTSCQCLTYVRYSFVGQAPPMMNGGGMPPMGVPPVS